MAKKVFWIILTVIALLAGAYLIILRLAPNAIPTNMPIIGKLTCPYPVKIAGSSMSPALQEGARLTFDRCSGDKLNLQLNTIIAFQEGETVRISRIIGKNTGNTNVIYKTAQDAKPNNFIDVPASDIIAIYKK